MTEHEWLQKDKTHLQELEVAHLQTVQMEKTEKQSCLTNIETLKQKIGKLDDQLRLSKENLDTYVSPQAEDNNINDIPPNISGNTINKNYERIEYDAEEKELGTVAANSGID